MYAVSMKDQRLIAVSSANGHRPAMLCQIPPPPCVRCDLRLHGGSRNIAVHRHWHTPPRINHTGWHTRAHAITLHTQKDTHHSNGTARSNNPCAAN